MCLCCGDCLVICRIFSIHPNLYSLEVSSGPSLCDNQKCLPKKKKKGLQTLLNITHMHAKLLQSYPTLCDPMDCSLPGSSVRGIRQA